MKKLMLSVLLALGFLTANAAKTTLTGHYKTVGDTQQELKLTLELTPTDDNKVRLSYTCEREFGIIAANFYSRGMGIYYRAAK